MRLQLALNVSNLDEAIDFYGRLFGAEPYKIKPGYANFAIENPPLKLVLFEGVEAPGSINHLGVEVDTAAEVIAAEQRMSDSGLATTGIDDTVCCYAEKTETWVTAPDNLRWEYYVKNGDTAQMMGTLIGAAAGAAVCCASDEVVVEETVCCASDDVSAEGKVLQ